MGDFEITNKREDIIDSAVTTRRNGLILLGMNKPLHRKNKPCSPHYVCYADSCRTSWFGDEEPLPYGWQFENKNKNVEYKEILEMAFGWVFSHDYTKKEEVPAPVSAPISPVTTAPVQTEGTFNLAYFLEVLGRFGVHNRCSWFAHTAHFLKISGNSILALLAPKSGPPGGGGVSPRISGNFMSFQEILWK